MIETTTKFVTTVDDLPAAWTFVMNHIDRLGPDPRVHINPVWIMGVAEALQDGGSRSVRRFEVAVSGMVQEEEASDASR